MRCGRRKCMKRSFGHQISALYRHLQIHLNQEFTAFGFGSGQYLYFNHIAKNEGITQKELSDILAIDKATTAKAIHKLSKQDYIQAEQDPDDRRCYRLFLTEKGHSILPEVRKIMKKTTSILSKGMTREQAEETLQYLHTMYKNITEQNEKNRRDGT